MSRFWDMGPQDSRYTSFMRRLLLTAFLIATAGLAQQPATPKPVVHPAFPTGDSTPLGQKISTLLADPTVSRAHWGIAVTALDGTPIYGFDEGKLFRPASNAKLFTTAAAMALLGPDVRVKTMVEMMANPEHEHPAAGVFDGDIVIVGDGDAFLSDRPATYDHSYSPGKTDPLKFIEETAGKIAATGVHTIKGTIYGNAQAWMGDPFGETWSREDTAWGYGAPVSALTVNDNQLRLTLTPGKDIFQSKGNGDYRATAQLYPDTGFYKVTVDVSTTSGQASNVWVDHPDGPRSLHVYGHIKPGMPYTTEIAIDDPPLFAAEALKQALERHGVKMEAEVTSMNRALPGNDPGPDLPTVMVMHPTEQATQQELEEQTKQTCSSMEGACKIVGEHVSPTMAEDVTWTLKESQNLHAEMLLRRLAYRYGADPTAADGTWAMRQWLIESGLDGNDFVFYDGSGLSPKDLVTPRATATLLSYATTQSWFAQWKAALPIGGVDGTLSSRFKEAPLKGHVFAKTGTLGESRALSGYLDCASGKQVIFSIMVDNHTPAGSADRAVMDKIVAAIAAEN